MATVQPVLDLDNLTPYAAMNADFAKKVTGGDELDEVQKKQIREQQKVPLFAMSDKDFSFVQYMLCCIECISDSVEKI